jgi:hypothetical protein
MAIDVEKNVVTFLNNWKIFSLIIMSWVGGKIKNIHFLELGCLTSSNQL